MGMYTELVLGVEIVPDDNVIGILRHMLDEIDHFDGDYSHPLFETPRWSYMLNCGSWYFDGQTDSKLFTRKLCDYVAYFLNVRCNLKNYDDEIELFLDWLNPYIKTQGFLGYYRYEEFENPTLIYKDGENIVYK